jgi:hexosaminidase
MYRRMETLSRDLEWLGLRHRANYIPMLQRMADGHNVAALKTLVDTLEPAKMYSRSSARKYTSATPLNRVVDAARPESAAARVFPADLREARKWLERWRDQYDALQPAMAGSFLLKEVEPVSADVAALGTAGLEALDYVARSRRPAETWVQQANALLERVSKPRAEVVIAIVPPVRKLIESAGRLP